MKNVGVNETHV